MVDFAFEEKPKILPIFYHGEKSMTLAGARDVKMELIIKSGEAIVLKKSLAAGL